MNIKDITDVLVELGFTGLEAEVYITLLRQSPITGYRIAQELGKPVANTYKAIESLRNKGAVIVDEGENRLCRAIPAEELLGQIERRFRVTQKRAAKALSKVKNTSSDDRVYQLRSREQVMERCRRMLRDSRQLALLDIFPEPLNELSSEIEEAATRGTVVALKAYRPHQIRKAEVLVEPAGESILARWPGQWVNLVIDDAEFLLAFLSSDGKGVHQAIWSNSVYLSWVYSGALASELMLAGLQALIEEGASGEELQKAFKRFHRLKPLKTPGHQAILRRFSEIQVEAE